MEIKYGKQIDFESIRDEHIDLFIIGGNHEKRVFTLYNKITKVDRSIMFRFKDEFVPTIPNFELFTIKNCTQIYSLLEDVFSQHNGEKFTLLVDYSCMTKSWYYSIILFLSKKKLNQRNIRVIFSYTPSKYSDPQTPLPNSDISPLPGKYVIPTDKPKALIVCLGYEKNKAEGIIEHLDPKFCHIFYTKPSLDPKFSEKVEENNSNIIKNRKNQITTYSFDDLISLERSLNALYQTLKRDYSIIIAPLGPKPFALVSMIMAAKYPEIDIWRVGSGYDINEYDRECLKDNFFIINDVHFSNI